MYLRPLVLEEKRATFTFIERERKRKISRDAFGTIPLLPHQYCMSTMNDSGNCATRNVVAHYSLTAIPNPLMFFFWGLGHMRETRNANSPREHVLSNYSIVYLKMTASPDTGKESSIFIAAV